MGERKQRPVTVKVVIHVGADGRVAVGIVGCEWNGRARLDRRLYSARELEGAEPVPAGVMRPVWRAWCALGDLIREQVRAYDEASRPAPR